MLVSSRRVRVVACSLWVALGLPVLATGSVAPAAAARHKPLPHRCDPPVDPKLAGSCVLDEAFEPCTTSGSGCVRVGGGSLRPVAPEVKIAVSPSVVPVGGSLTVTLSGGPSSPCPFPITDRTPPCLASVSFGDPRQLARYLPLDYSAVFNPPLLRFPTACSGAEAPLSCTATVLRGFGPRTLLTDHYMIAGATVEFGGGGNSVVDYLEAPVGVSDGPALRLSGKVTGFDTPIAGATVEALGPHNETVSTATDASGRYQFGLLRGRYRVAVAGGTWEPTARRVVLHANRSGVDFRAPRAGRFTLGSGGPTFEFTTFSFTNPSTVVGPGQPPTSVSADVHVTLIKLVDTNSAALFQDAANGRVFPQATLAQYKPNSSTVAATFTLKDVVVDAIRSVPGAPELESVQLSASSKSM